jgi:hypothetical protein
MKGIEFDVAIAMIMIIIIVIIIILYLMPIFGMSFKGIV